MVKNYNVLIKDINNQIIDRYNKNFDTDNLHENRKKVIENLILDYKYLGVDITKKYNINLLFIEFTEINR